MLPVTYPKTDFDACGKLNCDGIVIVAKDDLNNETNTIPRGANKTLKTLNLSAASLDGADLSKGVTYRWERRAITPDGLGQFVAFSSTQAAVSIGVPGKYTLAIVRGTTTCTTEIAINAKPCTETPDPTGAVVCTTPALTAVADEAANRLTNLAPGDVVRCGDFNITIIEATGNANGWNGKGYVKVPYLNAEVSIILRNTVFNDCYQLTNANATAELPTVYTEYDPQWGSIADVDNILANFKSSLQGIIDIMNNFSGKCEDVRALDKAVKEYEQGFSQPNSTYTEAERTVMLTKINDLKTKRDQLVSCSSCSISSGRIAAANDVTVDCGPKAIECRDKLKEMLGDAKEEKKQCHPTNRLLSSTRLTAGDTDKFWLENIIKGTWAHNIIEEDYRVTTGSGQTVYLEYAIPATGSAKDENYGYADIVNETTAEIFEIKTVKGQSDGAREVTQYVNSANFYCKQITPRTWEKGANYPSREFIWPLDITKKLIVNLAESGVITYDIIDNINPKLNPVPVYQPIPQAVKDKLKQLAKNIMRNPTPAYAELQTRILFATLSTAMIYTLITTGVVGNIAAVFEEIGTAGIGTPAIAVQALVCTTMITVGYQILKTR